jgi:CheY-like chemotaxis protein
MPNNGDTLVLVADDEPSMLGLVSAYVRSKGYRVLEASDGDNAWQLAREHLPDVVVLDVMMPGMSGWEVCKKIRESISLAHTGIVMLTGIGQSLNEMTSPLYGADAYIDKPFEFAELESRIRQTLEQRRKGQLGRPDEGETDDSAIEDAPPSLRSNDDDDEDDDDLDDEDDDEDDDDDEAPASAPRSKGSEKGRTRGVPTRDTLESGIDDDDEDDDDDDLGDPDDEDDDEPAPAAKKKAKRATKKTASPASLSPEGFDDEPSDEELKELLNNGPKKGKKKAAKKASKKAVAKKVSKKAAGKKVAGKKVAKKAAGKKVAKKVSKKAVAKKVGKKASKKAVAKKVSKKAAGKKKKKR